MSDHRRLVARAWMVPVAGIVLVGSHLILYVLRSHLALSAAVVSGVIVLLVIKHVGLLSAVLVPLASRFRRRFRR